MKIGLLGDLQVLDDNGSDLPVAGAKLRALLALLSLNVGRPVASERLIDALWGEDPPPAVRNGLQGLVSKLRRAIGSSTAVSMRGAGYVLALPPHAVDVHRYEELVSAGHGAASEGDPALAIARLNEAESLWRGDAFADFVYEEWAAPEIARLNEQRLAAVEESLGLELSLGRHHAVVVTLEALVAANPLRETLRGLLMLALYRAGRQADALRAFQEGRHLLAEELGLEPGPELRRLESAILAQDKSVAPPTSVPAPGNRSAPRTTIPEPLTPLVGRVRELSELRQLFGRHRLVTLVGPGGVGKTRLALELARAEAASMEDGGVLVELAPVRDPAAVPGAVATALNLPDPSRLAEVIGDRDLLVVLDNCEHVIATAAGLAEDLLQRCPRLRLLATSREGLRVGGEAIWPVPPLPTDDAIQLFWARAEAAGSQQTLADDAVPVVADICARLDGLPLAVELAAARTRAFPIQQIAARLQDRFRLLTGGSRTALPRQQTLRAVVDWSYDLLFEDEKRLLERLSVFPGGCDLATIEAVCADDTLPGGDVGDIVHALVDKSLVTATPAGAEVRFTQLQTLAQYGSEKLAERGDAERVRNAMAMHFADLCRESADAYMGEGQRSWLMRIDQEHDNLRGALEWAVASDDAETALAIAGGTSWPHWLAAKVVEGRRWLDDAFACGGDVTDRTRCLALIGRGLLDFNAGVTDQVDSNLETALAIATELDDTGAHLLAQSFYAEVAAVRGDVDEARRRRLAVLAFYGQFPDDPFFAAARAYSQAKLAVLDGDLEAAEGYFREATEGFRTTRRPLMYSMCLDTVAEFDERAGDRRSAIARLEESLDTNASLGLGGFAGSVRVRLAWLLLLEGEVAGATRIYVDAIESARWLGNEPVLFLGLAGLASIELLEGHRDAAASAAAEALELHLAGGPRRFKNRVHPEREVRTAAAACCTVLSVHAAGEGNWEQAAQLLGSADRLREEVRAAVPPFQAAAVTETCEETTAAIGQSAFDAAFEYGRTGRLGVDVRFSL